MEDDALSVILNYDAAVDVSFIFVFGDGVNFMIYEPWRRLSLEIFKR